MPSCLLRRPPRRRPLLREYRARDEVPPFQSGPDGWTELLGKMRRGDINERTGVLRRIEQLTLVMSRHVDDGHLEAAVAEQHCRFEPVHDRHIDIDDDHI